MNCVSLLARASRRRFPNVLRSLLTSALLVALAAAPAFADEIVFKNGDRITGKITAADAGKITITSAVAGSVTVKMEDVKTFSTDEPITMKMKGGTQIRDTVTAAPDAGVITAPGAGQPTTITITDIDKINPPPIKWTGSVTAAAVANRGNTDNQGFTIAATAVRRREDDRLTFSGGYNFSSEKGNAPGSTTSTITDNWFVLGKYDYFFTKKFYGYGLLKVEKDRVADLNLRVSPGVGVGYQWVESADFNFSTEAGLSVIHEEHTVNNAPPEPVPGEHIDSEDHLAARFAYHVDKKLTPTLTAFHNLEFLPNVQDTTDFNISADAGLRVPVYKSVFAEFKAEWKYDATPAPGSLKNDFRYIASLGLTF
jgi:putative salt-induced outer membrane protein YdiY